MAAKPFSRNQRLEEEMRKLFAELLLLEAKDPRLQGVTVSGVRLSRDRTRCRIFFSVIGDAERERQAADGFTAARSFLRRELGQRMRMRSVPELAFERDTSFEYGDRIERVLSGLKTAASQQSDDSTEDE